MSERSDAGQADLQDRGRSHVPGHLQTRRRSETRPAHPADHLAHGQSEIGSQLWGHLSRPSAGIGTQASL